jgi:hypothetical protein
MAGMSALLVLATASVARADFTATGVCGGSNFSTCASVQLTWSGSTATLTITNAGALLPGTGEAVFASIGLTNLPADYVWSTTGNTFNGWTQAPPNNLSGDGIEDAVAQLNAPNPSSKKGLDVGQSLTFVFNFTGLTSQQIAQVGVGIHAISGPEGCSTKINIAPSGSTGSVTNSPTSYTGCGASTVPEPATIGLVTTGLLGLGGAGFMKRRKKA